MAEKVIGQQEISLNGVRYPIVGQVQSSIASQYPPKIVMGDVNAGDDPRLSSITWNDWTGGLGLNHMESAQDGNRFYWSGCQTQYKGHLLMARQQYTTTSGPPTPADLVMDIPGNVMVTGGIYVKKYDGTTWVSMASLASVATDGLRARIGGTEYAVVARGAGYEYTSDFMTWTDRAKATEYLTFWDDRLWGIGSTSGQLWSALVLGTETDDAILPLPDDYINDLFVGPDASGEPIIYASTQLGLFAHDAANGRFVQTQVRWPLHTGAGQGCAVWNGEMYIPVGMSVWRYDPRTGSVTSVGPDQDAGVDLDHKGVINKLVASHDGLFAVVNDATARSILQFDGTGWHVVVDPVYAPMADAVITDEVTGYRLWFSLDVSGTVWLYGATLYPEHADPDNTALEFNTGSHKHILPWFDAGQYDVDKLAVALHLETTDCSTSPTRTVEVEFGLDNSTAYHAATHTIETDGLTTLYFTDTGFSTSSTVDDRTGMPFRSMRFRLTLTNSSGNSNSPDLRSMTLKYRKKLPAKYGLTFELDINRDYNGKSPKDLRENLITAIESNQLVEFTYRDDDGSERNYWVDVASVTGLDNTGLDERGTARVSVVEV